MYEYLEQNGCAIVPYEIIRKMRNEIKVRDVAELILLLSVLNSIISYFEYNVEYGTEINITKLANLMATSRRNIQKRMNQLEKYDYIKTQLIGNVKYFKITEKTNEIYNINIKE